jgi:hypothetical protein
MPGAARQIITKPVSQPLPAIPARNSYEPTPDVSCARTIGHERLQRCLKVKARRRASGSLVKESVTDFDATAAPAVASQNPPSDQIAAALVVITIIVGIVTVGV